MTRRVLVLLFAVLCLFARGVSAEVIANGQFEGGTTGWLFYTNGTGSFAASEPGHESARAARVSFVSPGTNNQLYQHQLSLMAGTEYSLSFWARGPAGKAVSISILKHLTPYTSYGLGGRSVTLSSEWTRYDLRFVADGFQGTVQDGRLMFWFGGASGGDEYWLDDVSMKPVEAPSSPAVTRDILISWDYADMAEVDGFNIWLGNAPGAYTQQIKVVGKTREHRIEAVPVPVTLCVAMTAYADDGRVSEMSDESCAVLEAPQEPGDPLGVPVNILISVKE